MYIQPKNPYGYNFCPCCGHKINQMPSYSGPLIPTGPIVRHFSAANASEPTKITYPIQSPESFLDLLS